MALHPPQNQSGIVLNSLGFECDPSATRVVVAMSGGVDSSVTAALLVEEGYDVVGVTLQLYDHGAAIERPGACCAGADIHDARQVAERLGIAHYVLDYESRFRESVMDDFADAYVRGETPIPCVRCNQTVKFRDLLDTAKDLGADCMATGHYVRRSSSTHGAQLLTGHDPKRDQSYFLFATTKEQLDFLRFPVGDMTKDEVRAHAMRFGLKVAEKPDSQDICFVPNGDYVRVIEKLRPGAMEPGDVVSMDGEVLGTHQGIVRFTIGQRRGIGVGGTGDPLYVVRLEPESRRVVVGPREALLTAEIAVQELNWLSEDDASEAEVSVKIRSMQNPVSARVHRLKGDMASIVFDTPEGGVSPGQAAVIYDGNRVLGGGWIKHTVSALAEIG